MTIIQVYLGLQCFMRYLFLLLMVLATGCADKSNPLVLSGKTMGTTYRVLIADPTGAVSASETQSKIDNKLIKINSLMSNYDPDSEISRFNRAAPGVPFNLHPDTVKVLAFSLALADQTGGAFDPTVGPLVELWGFGSAATTAHPPEDHRIQTLKQHVGYQSLHLDTDSTTVSSPIKRQLDFSAAAKGFAVDAIATILVQLGHSSFLVEVGGELFAKGEKRLGQPWRVAIEMPSAATRAIYRAFPLIDSAIATSGDYRNYFEANGQRFSHTIDPRTGYPITHDTTSVTVLAPTAMAADGWATALNVLGPVAGMRLAEAQGLAVVMLVADGNELKALESQAFKDYLAQNL